MNKAAQKLGKMGGKATIEKYGKKHFSNAGKIGMAKRWAKKKEAPVKEDSHDLLYKD